MLLITDPYNKEIGSPNSIDITIINDQDLRQIDEPVLNYTESNVGRLQDKIFVERKERYEVI